MKNILIVVIAVSFLLQSGLAQEKMEGVRGDPEAIAEANAMERAPYSIYRIARAVAIGDPHYEIRFGKGGIQGSRRLEFYGPDGVHARLDHPECPEGASCLGDHAVQIHIRADETIRKPPGS